MKTEIKGHTIILKDTTEDFKSFVAKITTEYHQFKDKNIILDGLQLKNFDLKEVSLLKDVLKIHQNNKKSLVLVIQGINFNKVPNYITIVPTILEAHDLIEMDEIERDLFN